MGSHTTQAAFDVSFAIFVSACVSSGGKSREQAEQPNYDPYDNPQYAEGAEENPYDNPQYAEGVDSGEQEAIDPYDNPQYAEGDNSDPYDNPQYAEGAEVDPYDNPQYADGTDSADGSGIDQVEEQDDRFSVPEDVSDTNPYYNPEYADGIDGQVYNEDETVIQDSVVADEVTYDPITGAPIIASQDSDATGASEPEVVYEQVGVDENGQPIMAVVQPVDPLEKFGPNPYLQSPPYVAPDAQVQFEQAIALLREDKVDEASVILEQLNNDNVQLSGPAYNLGVIAYQQDDYDKSLEWLDTAISRNAYNLDAKNLKAKVLKEQAKFDLAEQEYKQIIELWGAYLPAYRNLGILYDLYMGKLRLAQEQYTLYDELSPEEDKQVKGWIAAITRQIGPLEPPAPDPVVDEPVVDEFGAEVSADSTTDSTTDNAVDPEQQVEGQEESIDPSATIAEDGKSELQGNESEQGLYDGSSPETSEDVDATVAEQTEQEFESDVEAIEQDIESVGGDQALQEEDALLEEISQ